MTVFYENKKLTLEGNLYDLKRFAKIGDVYTDGVLEYRRVDARTYHGIGWILDKRSKQT